MQFARERLTMLRALLSRLASPLIHDLGCLLLDLPCVYQLMCIERILDML